MRKLLYIAGPMTGLPGYNYHAFNSADAALRIAGYETRNPTSVGTKFGSHRPYEFYIREGLRMMLDCHGVALLDGWGRSRGALLEVTVAHACGLDVATVAEWKERSGRKVGHG